MYFSCIITCYNREDKIITAITSILDQSYQDFEIIVVDDASKDRSIEVIKTITDPRVRIIEHSINQGQNAALNSGVAASKYEHIAFLDSDDCWTKDYLLEMSKAYINNPDISFAYCRLAGGPKWHLEGSNKYAEVLNQGHLSSMITITALKNAILEVGGFDLKYRICQDDDFCFRLAEKFSFKVIEKELAIVLGAPNSMTNNHLVVAKGWAFLFNDYKAAILLHCGAKTYSRHMLNVAKQFFYSNKWFMGLSYYFLSLYYFIKPSSNKFVFSITDFAKGTFDISRVLLGSLKKIF